MTKREVVEILASEQRVENLVRNICKVARSDLDDLSQMIYLALLEYDEERLVCIYESNQINFFLARIIKNQFFSKTSQYFKDYRKFSKKIEDDAHFL